ncbi:MAG: VWA domain-containing protein [Thermoanaerobaculaceae bacterium]|nr:VWA domain-containing protein [Thermoanaerobaculaceae bacterium]
MHTKVKSLLNVPFLLLAVAALAQVAPPVEPAAEKPPAAKAPARQIGGLRFLDVSELTVVNVDVSVVDKKGPVLGLKASDFEVYQDGKPQPLTNFAAFTREAEVKRAATATPAPAAPPATPTAAPAATPVAPREPRFIAFYVDNENLMPFNRNRVITKMADWVRDNLTPPDQAMVVSYQRSVKILQPFTSDPDEIAAALGSVKRYVGGRSDLINSRRRVEDYIAQNSGQNSGGANANAYYEAMDEARGFAREQRNNLTFTVRALQDLVGMMGGLPGKKSIIYLSDGLPMTPGAELFYSIQDAFRTPNAISESREFDSTDLFDSLVRTATSSGVTLYTIDARGLESDLGIEAENREARSSLAAAIATSNYQDSLVYMADRTGGIAILNANDPTPGLEKIANDIETYYSLGYRLIPSGEDRLHRIQVKLKTHPEYKLVYKRTFIEKSLPTRIGDRVMSGLAFDLNDNPLGIELKVGTPAPADNGRWTLPVEVDVPFDKVALIPDGEDLIGYVMVYYAARDDDGKQSDLEHTEHAIRIPAADYQKSHRQQMTISTSLLVNPGRYRISVGVRDELTNQAGYALARASVHPEDQQ